jgi:hypothetical protein
MIVICFGVLLAATFTMLASGWGKKQVMINSLAIKLNKRTNMMWAYKQSTAPYLDALVDFREKRPLRSSFFFPGHRQGSLSPDCLRRAIGDSALTLDLPELDETDNLHYPTVS